MGDPFWAGYNDYWSGISVNPYSDISDWMDWERGWHTAHENFSGEDS